MLNYLWAGMILTGILFGAFNGKMADMTNAALDSAGDAVTLCITMIALCRSGQGLWKLRPGRDSLKRPQKRWGR